MDVNFNLIPDSGKKIIVAMLLIWIDREYEEDSSS